MKSKVRLREQKLKWNMRSIKIFEDIFCLFFCYPKHKLVLTITAGHHASRLVWSVRVKDHLGDERHGVQTRSKDCDARRVPEPPGQAERKVPAEQAVIGRSLLARGVTSQVAGFAAERGMKQLK